MPLKTLVKVGNISNLSDARYCAGMGVEMLGFQVVEGQSNYLDSKTYQQIRGWVSVPSVVAELYGTNEKTDVKAIIEQYAPNFLEIDSLGFNAIKETNLPLILSLDEGTFISASNMVKALEERIAFIIIDSAASSLEFIKEMASKFSVLVKVGSESDIGIIEKINIKGIALNGNQEIKPGLKDYDHLAGVLEQLELD